MSKGRENELKSGESLNTIFNIGIPIKRGRERKERDRGESEITKLVSYTKGKRFVCWTKENGNPVFTTKIADTIEEYIILIVVKNPLTMKREKQLSQQTLTVLKQLERERERIHKCMGGKDTSNRMRLMTNPNLTLQQK